MLIRPCRVPLFSRFQNGAKSSLAIEHGFRPFFYPLKLSSRRGRSHEYGVAFVAPLMSYRVLPLLAPRFLLRVGEAADRLE